MMGLVSVVVVRWRLTLFPALCFMVFVAYRVHTVARANPGTADSKDMLAPLMIGVGLILMHRGRTPDNPWSWTFWAGKWIEILWRVDRYSCITLLHDGTSIVMMLNNGVVNCNVATLIALY